MVKNYFYKERCFMTYVPKSDNDLLERMKEYSRKNRCSFSNLSLLSITEKLDREEQKERILLANAIEKAE